MGPNCCLQNIWVQVVSNGSLRLSQQLTQACPLIQQTNTTPNAIHNDCQTVSHAAFSSTKAPAAALVLPAATSIQPNVNQARSYNVLDKNLEIELLQSNPVITTSVYATPRLSRQIFCCTN
jgi:hypothetical protein